MIVQRLIGAGFDLLVLVVVLQAFCALMRRLAGSASLSCPRCRYSLAGVHAAHCPECGWALTAARWIESRMLTSRALLAAIALTGLVVTFPPAASAARDLLEVNRLAKVGDTAFLPGYSLLDETTNFVDLGIIAGGIAAYVVVSVLLIRGCAGAVAEYRERTTQIAVEYQRGLASAAGAELPVGAGGTDPLPPEEREALSSGTSYPRKR